MADIEASSWDQTDSNNNSTPPAGWPSGTTLPSQVEPGLRAMMGALKRDWAHKGPTVTSGGSANAQTLTYSVAPAAYVQGQVFSFLAGFSNTGPMTLNVNGLGAKNVVVIGSALAGGEILVGAAIKVGYDGTNFQLLSCSGSIPIIGGATTGAWVNYTPTLSAQSGTFTSASPFGRYKLLGQKTVFVEVQVGITTNGTAAGAVQMTLPFTAFNAPYILAGRATVVSGKAVTGTISASDTKVVLVNYDNTYPGASGETIVASGVYEAA